MAAVAIQVLTLYAHAETTMLPITAHQGIQATAVALIATHRETAAAAGATPRPGALRHPAAAVRSARLHAAAEAAWAAEGPVEAVAVHAAAAADAGANTKNHNAPCYFSTEK